MISSRERLIKTFTFDNPDKLAVYYHPSPAGLYVHGQKLLDLFNEYPPDNYIVFNEIPNPSADAFDTDGRYHEFKTDQWQVKWEYRIFGIAGHPCEFPLEDFSTLDSYKFPALPEIDKNHISKLKKNYMIWAPTWISIFEILHSLRPFEAVLIDIYTKDKNIIKLVDKIVEWNRKLIKKCIEADCDIFSFGDDWATQNSLFLSPEIFREIFKPRIADLIKPIKDAGKKVLYHCCGAAEPLFKDFIDLGIDCYWHQMGLYDDEAFAKKAADVGIVLYLHLDRQNLIPKASPAEIEQAVKKYADIHKKLGGGAIFYVEIENDAPFENVEALIRSIDLYR